MHGNVFSFKFIAVLYLTMIFSILGNVTTTFVDAEANNPQNSRVIIFSNFRGSVR